MSSLGAIVATVLILCVHNACALPPFEIRSAPDPAMVSSEEWPASPKRMFGLYHSVIIADFDFFTLCIKVTLLF